MHLTRSRRCIECGVLFFIHNILIFRLTEFNVSN